MTEKLPLRTAGDCEKWLEKAINEAKENNSSIALSNARISCVKAKVGLERLRVDYAKLTKQGARVEGMQEFLQITHQS